MARRTFFSFHFDRDIWRANQVRNSNVVLGTDRAGFFDHSEYEEAKRTGEEGIKRMILRHLTNTTVTVVLLGTHTASRPWVQYEIAESAKRKNGLLGIYINHLQDALGYRSEAGLRPLVPIGFEFPCYQWNGDVRAFAQQIELAGQRADAMRAGPPRPLPFRGF